MITAAEVIAMGAIAIGTVLFFAGLILLRIERATILCKGDD